MDRTGPMLAAYLKAGRAGDARTLIERRTDRRAMVRVEGFLA